ncbi:MAG: hypothetical protein ACXWCX_25420 [Burkholderiales bacterium]
MLKVKNGNYVSNADYDALHEALALVLQTASAFFRQIAAGELTASDTDTTLGLLVNPSAEASRILSTTTISTQS